MSTKRFLPLAVIVALLAPTVAVLPGALAQDTVPTSPSVPFETVSGVPVRFYLNFPNAQGSSQPSCDATTFRLGLVTNESSAESIRTSCQITGGIQTPLGGGSAPTATFTVFDGLRPLRAVTLPGNNSVYYTHSGPVVASATPGGTGPLTITLSSGDNPIARGTLAVGQTTTNLSLVGGAATTGRGVLAANQPFKVSVSAPEVLTFRMSDAGPFVELRAEDAIKAALWTADEKSVPRDIYQPIPNGTTPAPDKRIVGFFAMQSAYGFAEVTRGEGPTFQILRNGTEPREIGPGGATFLEGSLNSTASTTPSGIAVWSFPLGTGGYMGFPAGSYTLQSAMTHNGAAISKASQHAFQITAQSVRIEPFRDPRVATLVDVEAHTVVPGGSTTYLLGVANTGSVADNFTINVTSPNPPAGWSATIGGPDVRGRTVYVPAGNTSLITITVSAPLNAGTADRIIHLVNATSTIDPGARSGDRTLVTTVGTAVTRDLAILVTAPNLTVEPGSSREIPVYAWNRGTRTTNVSLETPAAGTGGWSAQLMQGSTGVERVVLNNVAPGAIAEATLRVNGPPNQAVTSFGVLLNATAIETSGVATDRTLTFRLATTPGIAIKLLDTVNGREHRVELGADGVDGTWFRTWITNTGRSAETVELTVDSVTLGNPTCGDGGGPGGGIVPAPGGSTATTPFTDRTIDAGDGINGFGFYFRSSTGNPQRIVSVPDLGAGTTAEVYVWVPIDRAGPSCADNTMSFVIQARGATSGIVARAGAKVTAEATPTNGIGTVNIEAVGREKDYASTAPLVDASNAERRQITGGIEVGGEPRIYLLRITNGASFRPWTSGAQSGDPTVHVVLEGVDRDSGWNASVRPVVESADMTDERNPWAPEYNLSNANPFASDRRESWIDREIQVRVQAPNAENGTALAGEQDQIQVRAFINGSATQTFEIKTVVVPFANVTARAEDTRIFAHPGQASPFLIYVTNNGSSPGTVTLRTSINSETTPNAAAWRVEPNSQTFPLAAFKNRTVALLVTPPAGAAQGSTGEVNLTIEYAKNPLAPTVLTTTTQRLTAEIVAPSTLSLTASASDATLSPGGFANYTMTLRNSGGLTVPYTMSVTDIPNWTETLSPASGQLGPGESRPIVLVLRAPDDVTNEARFAAVVGVQEVGAANNFDALAVTANILGGKPVPSLSVPQLTKRVDRGGTTDFEVAVKNLGSAAGPLKLEVRSTEGSWNTTIRGPRGDRIDTITLAPNELATINVSVTAPRNVPERFINTVEITALTEDRSQASRAALQAEIHDYGVRLELVPSTIEGLPGIPTEVTLRVRNTGNDNDTLNVSADLRDLPEWAVQLSQDEIRLEPGASAELRATIRSPVSPLPTARTYSFPFWVGTRGGQAVDLPKNETQTALLTIPSYRAFDMDRDGSQEIVVDQDRRSANGFEAFREVFTDGVQSQVVSAAQLDGKARFFLDVPRDRPYDGIADVWFDPEGLFAFEIASTPDLNQDGTPDYLIDTDHDAKIDMGYDTVTDRYFTAVEIKAFGDDRIQYLVDLTGDGKPDRFFDPEANVVTKTSATSAGDDKVGLDTDNDNRVDKYYDINTKDVSDAKVAQFSDFARNYWYFFVAFAALVVVVIALVVVRRR